MKTYWDYTEKERANMSKEEVEKLLDAELMTKGVLKVNPPVFREVKKVSLNTFSMYEVGSVVFDTSEQADAFIKLNPKHLTYDWTIDSDYKFPEVTDTTIKKIECYKKAEVKQLKSILSQNKETENYNKNLETEYSEQSKKMSGVLNGVWEDWFKCQERQNNLLKVLDTKEHYIKLADNNESIARTFLLKVYNEEEVKAAEEWFSNGK